MWTTIGLVDTTTREGTATMMAECVRLAIDGSRSREIQELAYRLSSDAQPVQRIFEFVRDQIGYRHDPAGREDIVHPVLLARRAVQGAAWADCEDIATLAISLARAAGVQSHLVAYGNNREWTHFAAELFDGGRWVAVDPVAGRALNTRPPASPGARTMTMNVSALSVEGIGRVRHGPPVVRHGLLAIPGLPGHSTGLLSASARARILAEFEQSRPPSEPTAHGVPTRPIDVIKATFGGNLPAVIPPEYWLPSVQAQMRANLARRSGVSGVGTWYNPLTWFSAPAKGSSVDAPYPYELRFQAPAGSWVLEESGAVSKLPANLTYAEMQIAPTNAPVGPYDWLDTVTQAVTKALGPQQPTVIVDGLPQPAPVPQGTSLPNQWPERKTTQPAFTQKVAAQAQAQPAGMLSDTTTVLLVAGVLAAIVFLGR